MSVLKKLHFTSDPEEIKETEGLTPINKDQTDRNVSPPHNTKNPQRKDLFDKTSPVIFQQQFPNQVN